MSQQIENQIVKMQFDNTSFEKNVQQSMSTLDKLKQALRFDKVNMTPLQEAFSSAEATATKAGFHIRDIWLKVGSIIEDQVAQKVVDAGKKMLNALSFEGINDGFKEYELKMGSIQTIMAGTGESLATVNRYLDALNTYSDQTIYSFADMTNNIGKFTNAGVKLDDAVNAIKGIANEAAVSGANANEASRAMYNFAQALSAGYVKLIDWKSIENANMATKEFKESLLDVAVACGTVEKTSDGMYKILTENNNGSTMDELVSGTKNFNDSLAYQWMTTEVLTKTLKLYATDIRTLTDEERGLYEQELKNMGLSDEQIKKFEELGIKATDAASEIKTFSMLMDTLKEAIGSGWAMTWQILIGDFEQAKSLWTSVGNVMGGVIDSMSESRNAFLKSGLQTGWERFTTMEGRAIPEAEKFREVLVDLAHEQGILSDEQYDSIDSTEALLKSFHDLNWVTGDLLKSSISDYVDILESMSDEELSSFNIKTSDVENLKKLSKELESGALNADDFAESMNALGGRENVIAGLSNIFQALLGTIRPIGEAFSEVFGLLDPMNLYDLTRRFKDFTDQIKVSDDAANTLKTSFTLAFTGIKTVIGAVTTAFNGVFKLILPVFNLFDAVFGLIGKVVSALTGSKGALDAADKFTKFGDKVSGTYLKAMQKLADFINKVADAIRNIPESTVFTKIHDGVISAVEALNEFWDSFVNMPVIQQMIEDFNNTIENIKKKLSPVVEYVKKSINGVKDSIKKNFNWETLNRILTSVYNKIKSFISIIKDFAERIKNFFTNLKEGKSIVDSFRDNFGDIIDRVKELKDNLMTFFSDLFAKGDELNGKFDLASIQQAIHDFVANITPEQVTMIAVAGTFMLIALNLLRLSEALKNAVDSFTGIGIALKNVINSYVKKQKSTILQIAEAIVIVAAALWVLSTIPENDLNRSVDALRSVTTCLAALTIALTGCGLLMSKLGGGKSMVELATGMVLVAGALMAATLTLKVLEYVSIEGVLPKLAVLAGVMLALTGLSVFMSKLDKLNKGCLTMLVCAGSLLMAAQAMVTIGEMPQDSLDKALDAMLKIMVGLAAITFAAGNVGIFSAVGLIAIVMALDKILPAIENIVNYDYTGIEKGLSKNESMLQKLAGVLVVMTVIGMLAGNRIKGAGIAMLAVAATFGILLGIAKLAGQMKETELRKGESFLLRMGVILSMLELFSSKSRLQMFGGKNGGEGSKAFIRIAIAMGILLGIAKLASMMDTKGIIKGELAIAGLAVLIGIMTKVAADCRNSSGVIKAVSAMLFAVSLILAEVALLSMIPMKRMLPAMGTILAIILSLSVLAAAISKSAALEEGDKVNWSGMISFIAALAGVVAIGIIIKQLADKDVKNVGVAALAISGVIVAVSILSKSLGKITGKFSKKQVQSAASALVMVAVLAAILGGLSVAMKKFNIDPATMLSAAGAITIVLAGLIPVLAILNKFNAYTGNNPNGGNYKKMTTAVGSIIALLIGVGASLALLSRFGGDGQKMIDSAIAIAIGMIAICAPLAILGKLGAFTAQINPAGMWMLVLQAVTILAGVGAAIWALSRFGNPDTMIASAQALALGLFAISFPIAVLGAVGQFCAASNPVTMGAATLAALGALFGVAATLVWFSNNINPSAIETLNSAIPILITCMVGVSGMATVMALIGLIPTPAIAAGAAAMLAAIVVLGAILAAIAGLGWLLDNVKGLQKSLITGLDFLVVIAGKIGEAFGAFVGGIGVGVTSQLSTIADNLTAFSEKLIPFAENMECIDADLVNSCKNLAAAMLYLTAADFLDGITRWIGIGSLDNFDFAPLGVAVSAFCETVKNLPEDSIKKASVCANIAKKLAEIQSTFETKGGLAGLIFGEKESLESFGEGVKTFGMAILSFCFAVNGLPENAVDLAQRAADAAVPMVELSKTLTSEGGWLQKIIGEKNIGTFGTNLTTFASGLVGFVRKLVTLDKISEDYPILVQKCADAMEPMTSLANGIENSGGILARVVGENTLDVFGDTLEPFADALYGFVQKLKLIYDEVPNFSSLIRQTATATSKLVELANSLENMGGIKGAIEGDNTLDKFGRRLEAFGASLSVYADSIKEIDFTTIDTANESIAGLVDLCNLSAETDASTAFTNLSTALNTIAAMPVSTISDEVVENTPILIENVTSMFTQITTLITDRMKTDKELYTTYGNNITMGIRIGITRNSTFVIQAINTLINTIKTCLGDLMSQSAFEVYGKNISLGLKKGIEDYSGKAIAAAQSLAEQINAIVPKTLGEKSPSRIAYRFGMNYDRGLAWGIRDYTGEAVASAEDMSNTVIDTANSIISSIARVIESDVDTQPTIRPVLDISDVQNKAKNIGKLFNASDLSLAYSASGSIRQMNDAKYADNYKLDEGTNEQQVPAQINFTQNNYSPKELSRYDIYRNTKNQLNMMKGVVIANA